VYACTRSAVTEKLCHPWMLHAQSCHWEALPSMDAARAELSPGSFAIHGCCTHRAGTVEACHPCLHVRTELSPTADTNTEAEATAGMGTRMTHAHAVSKTHSRSHHQRKPFPTNARVGVLGWKPLLGLFLLWYTSPHKNTHLTRDRDRRDLWYRGPKFQRSFPEAARRHKQAMESGGQAMPAQAGPMLLGSLSSAGLASCNTGMPLPPDGFDHLHVNNKFYLVENVLDRLHDVLILLIDGRLTCFYQ